MTATMTAQPLVSTDGKPLVAYHLVRWHIAAAVISGRVT